MKFFVTYNMPHVGLDEWMKLPEAERKQQEEEMGALWDAWTAEHKGVITETVGVGRPRRVTKDGANEERNDMMMYSIVEADSVEAAEALFIDHPHFGIPGSWIEVMPIRPL